MSSIGGELTHSETHNQQKHKKTVILGYGHELLRYGTVAEYKGLEDGAQKFNYPKQLSCVFCGMRTTTYCSCSGIALCNVNPRGCHQMHMESCGEKMEPLVNAKKRKMRNPTKRRIITNNPYLDITPGAPHELKKYGTVAKYKGLSEEDCKQNYPKQLSCEICSRMSTSYCACSGVAVCSVTNRNCFQLHMERRDSSTDPNDSAIDDIVEDSSQLRNKPIEKRSKSIKTNPDMQIKPGVHDLQRYGTVEKIKRLPHGDIKQSYSKQMCCVVCSRKSTTYCICSGVAVCRTLTRDCYQRHLQQSILPQSITISKSSPVSSLSSNSPRAPLASNTDVDTPEAPTNDKFTRLVMGLEAEI